MTVQDAIQALTDLDKATAPLEFVAKDFFHMTTQMLISGLRQPDESLVKDAIEHIEQAKRLLGGAS